MSRPAFGHSLGAIPYSQPAIDSRPFVPLARPICAVHGALPQPILTNAGAKPRLRVHQTPGIGTGLGRQPARPARVRQVFCPRLRSDVTVDDQRALTVESTLDGVAADTVGHTADTLFAGLRVHETGSKYCRDCGRER